MKVASFGNFSVHDDIQLITTRLLSNMFNSYAVLREGADLLRLKTVRFHAGFRRFPCVLLIDFDIRFSILDCLL